MLALSNNPIRLPEDGLDAMLVEEPIMLGSDFADELGFAGMTVHPKSHHVKKKKKVSSFVSLFS